MPEPTPILDRSSGAAEEAHLDELADAEIEAGRGVPHKKVRRWLIKLGRFERPAPPKA